MKKVLGSLLVVVFLLTSLGLTAFAADYTSQYLGDGFTRINLTNQAFVAGTERTFTVNIPEDGEYAVYFSNPNKTASTIKATFTKDGETKTASNNIATEAQVYVRLGVNGNAASSVQLTEGEWTLAIKAGIAITVPYIDIRSTVITLNGEKQAIYPMDANSISIAQTFGKSINEPTGTNYAKAPSDYVYYGNISDRTAPGAIILTKKNTAMYKIDVKYPGEYKITAYGKFRTTATVTDEDTATVNMTVGSNSAVSGSATFAANTRVNGWSSFISIEKTAELAEGETTVSFYNPKEDGVLSNWYLTYITVEGVNVEIPEEPEVPVEPEEPTEPEEPGEMTGPLEEENIETPFVVTKDVVVNYTNDAKAAYRTAAYADYSNTVVSKYSSSASAMNDTSVPVPVSWNALDGATNYKLYVSKSQDFTSADTRIIEGITATNYNIYNLETNRTYYWKVISGNTIVKAGTFKTADTVRFLTVEGVRNVRDIGGWNGLNQGMAYRGTELNLVGNNGYALTEEGKRVMHDDLGIKTDLDLRATGLTESPIGEDVNFIKVFISNYVAAFSETDKYATILATFADVDNYPIYFHCMGGADRTGTVGAIVEALAGADEADLSIDYELTGFSSVGARPRNSTTYKYKELIAGLKAYEGATLQDKTENYAIKTLGLTRKQVSNITSLMGGNMVVFADTAPVEVMENSTITLKNMGTNTVSAVNFKGQSIPFAIDGNVITVDIDTIGLGEIVFADGSKLKFEANSILPISFSDISNNQSSDFVSRNLTLPAGYTWTSSNPEVVSTTGVVTRPEFKDVVVELTANSEKGYKSIMFTVKNKTAESYSQSLFDVASLKESETDTAVLGTVGGNDSLVPNWYVKNANVASSTITKDGVLRTNFTSKSSSCTQVHIDLDEPASETMVIEFDMLNDWSNATNLYVDLFAKVEAPDGTTKDVRILQFDGSSNRLRSGVGVAHFVTLGGTDVYGIKGTKTNIRIEFNPVKMTARYAGMNSGNNWNKYTTVYPDLLNNRYQIDSVNITDINTLPDVNYEVTGFYFQPRGASATTADIDTFKVYSQHDCAVADMSVETKASGADVAIELAESYTGTMIIALYDENKALTGVKLVEMPSSKTASETVVCENTPAKANVFFVESLAALTPNKVNVPLSNTALEWK